MIGSAIGGRVVLEWIAENMRREWVEIEPGAHCFDRSEVNMAGLLAFIEGDRSEAVRLHLLRCSRCRFIYATIRGGR